MNRTVYVLGHVVIEVAERPPGELAPLLGSGEFPLLTALTALMEPASEFAGADEFERGLAWVLDGIEADLG
jgi:hypothetical protein